MEVRNVAEGIAIPPDYTTRPVRQLDRNKTVSIFIDGEEENLDKEVVESFGEEWSKFSDFSDTEIDQIGREYFDILPTHILTANSLVMDMGCGTGRWTKYLSNKVGFVDAVDPSKAIITADELLKNVPNIRLTMASSSTLPFPDNSFDMVMSIGVLHHIPDTQKAMMDCVRKVKQGGYFFTYLYYRFDNRGFLFRSIFRVVDFFRKIVSRMPSWLKKVVCDILAVLVYMPFVLLSRLFHVLGLKKLAQMVPLSYYRDKSFFVIRNDSLDRFGTHLEQRFTKTEITAMLEKCGLTNIRFSNSEPYWHVIARKE